MARHGIPLRTLGYIPSDIKDCAYRNVRGLTSGVTTTFGKKSHPPKNPTRLNLLSVKCRTFIQENRAAQSGILSQIMTAFLNFTISIVKTHQASKKQQIFRNPSKMPRKKSTSEKCLPILSLKSRRSGG